MHRSGFRPLTAWLGGWLALSASILAVQATERVVVRQDGQQRQLVGQAVVTARDGGMLLRTADGELWLLPAAEIVSRETTDEPFQPWTREQMSEHLLKEFGDGFQILTTDHYVICYNTSQVYAQWCGGLYERLLKAFMTHWRARGLDLVDPTFPLVALVFDSKDTFRRYAEKEVGEAANSMIGYYNLRTNRVTMYDLTGADSASARRSTTSARINQVLAQPEAERTVATIVHEATHQLCYNSGLQERLADNPFWVSEGLAIYFETPDLKSQTGWRNIGGVNLVNLRQFQFYLAQRPANSLETLLGDDQRFQDPGQITNAYAEAWALNYYMIRARRNQYNKYLQALSEKKPLVELTPQQRLAEFEAAFGDLRKFDEAFLKYMRRVH